jgi:hypothetical protein
MLVRHPLGRWSRPLAAAAAFAATLLLGLLGPALPSVRPLFGWGGLGVTLAGCMGLLAWHVAQASATPNGRAGLAGVALPSALLALAVPQIGAGALAIPCLLAFVATLRDSASRPAALAIHCGAGALLAGTAAHPWLGALAAMAVPALAWISLRGAAVAHANDNPSLERVAAIWPLQPLRSCAIYATTDSESGAWGVA